MSIRTQIGNLYARDTNAFWSSDEEHWLLDVSQRPAFDAELEIIVSFKKKVAARFFPQSVAKLLERWTDTLDRARNHNPRDYKTNGSISIHEMRTVIEAKKRQADKLRNTHCTETGLSSDWDSNDARNQFFALRKEIKALTAKLSSAA